MIDTIILCSVVGLLFVTYAMTTTSGLEKYDFVIKITGVIFFTIAFIYTLIYIVGGI